MIGSLNMDRNTFVVLIFGAFSFIMLGWLLSEHWHGKIVINETMTGAVIGGFLAGLFGILAAGYSIYHDRVASEKRRRESEEVVLHSIVTKLIDLNDTLLKNHRHLMIDDVSTRVSFGSGGMRHSFSKPLEGKTQSVRFSIEERTFMLRKFKADNFNKLNDISGISESFNFLHDRHVQAYYGLMDEVFNSKHEREGYKRTAEINPDSVRLMTMMDMDGAFRSFIDRAAPETTKFLLELITLSNENTSVNIRYEITDLPPSAENDKRTTY